MTPQSGRDASHMQVAQVFLRDHGWAQAVQKPLTPDASARRYARLIRGNETAILMLDPEGNTSRFALISRYLTEAGLSAPQILAHDPAAGLMLLEDLGDALFARVASKDPGQEAALYAVAGQALAQLHSAAPAPGLVQATPASLAQMIDLLFAHYATGVSGHDQLAIKSVLAETLDKHAPVSDVTVLRDFHAENLLWLPGRSGAARAGLLDFQDALLGHRAYDMVSMLHDARRAVSAGAAQAARTAYLQATGADAASFEAAMMVLGLQRNLRILGIFARLAEQRGKPGYLRLLPRVWQHIETELAHPALSRLAPMIRAAIPAPKGSAL